MMTVLDASNLMYKWFQENHSFKINKTEKSGKDDFTKLLIIDENQALSKLIIIKSLEEFQEQNIIKIVEDENSKYFVLSKPFEAYSQTVTIEPGIAIAISTIINRYCDSVKDETRKCKASSITSNDLQTLIAITLQLSNQFEKNQE